MEQTTRRGLDLEDLSKLCKECLEYKPLEDFYVDTRTKDGVGYICKKCTRTRCKQYYYDNKDRMQSLHRQYFAANRERNRLVSKSYHNRRKKELVAAYGGKCVCCGETEMWFLTIDHIFGDGSKCRKIEGGGGQMLYSYLRKLGYPRDRYQLLCYNCNCSKRQYGVCPHKKSLES